MVSRKTVLMNLFAGQEYRYRQRGWTCGHNGGWRGWDALREQHLRVHTANVCTHLCCVWFFATPTDCSPPDSSVHGIFQARMLKWIAISYSGGSSWPRDRTRVSWVSYIGRWILYQLSHNGSPVVNNPPANAGDVRDVGSIPGSGGSPGEDHGNPLQYSCLENPMDRGVWWATVCGVTKNRTRLKWLSTHTH